MCFQLNYNFLPLNTLKVKAKTPGIQNSREDNKFEKENGLAGIF